MICEIVYRGSTKWQSKCTVGLAISNSFAITYIRNGPAHVFGEYSKCNPSFCKQANVTFTCNVGPPQDSDPEDDVSHIDNDPDLIGFSKLIDAIIEREESDEPIPSDEADAPTSLSESTLNSLSEGLFANVQACGDHLVMLAPQLISNETSNLAECYMSIRSCFNGGRQYNWIQKGSFKHRYYAAGLRVQNGRQWPLDF